MVCVTAIQAVFRSVVLARFLHASPAYWCFATVQDRQKFMDFCAEASVLVSVPLIYLTLMA